MPGSLPKSTRVRLAPDAKEFAERVQRLVQERIADKDEAFLRHNPELAWKQVASISDAVAIAFRAYLDADKIGRSFRK